MGLDVYLYRSKLSNEEQQDVDDAMEGIWDSHYSSIEDWSELTEEERNEVFSKCTADQIEYCKEHNVECFKTNSKVREYSFGEERIEIDSKIHPEHMFKIGYFRSSYNPSGINSIGRERGLPDLYTIFSPPEEYRFQPNDWKTCLESAQTTLKMWKEEKEKGKGFWVMEVDPLDLVASASEALEIGLREAETWEKKQKFSPPGFPLNQYTCREGYFSIEGTIIHGLMLGTKEFLNQKVPCIYAFCKNKDGDDPLDWYIESLEIVIETCEYVLSQDDPGQYWLHWSS